MYEVPLHARVRRAFTLIELLVVIGIIALLLSILVPVLSTARTAAVDLKCMSNVRQITTALVLYATQYKGVLPPPQETTATDSPTWHARIWSQTIGRPFPNDQFRGDGTYSYLTKTVFECPQAEFSKLGGYSQTDHRKNGYAINNSLPGNARISPVLPLANNVSFRMREYKFFYRVQQPSRTMLLAESCLFFVDYYDRGSAPNSMEVAGNGNAGGMVAALGRHGKKRDMWAMGFCDGSVRMLQFNDVPGTPLKYYLADQRLKPDELLVNVEVPPATKMFWLGRDK
ncbi:MAG: type II secretion system protein [Tepidisphaeraceae bacterium]